MSEEKLPTLPLSSVVGVESPAKPKIPNSIMFVSSTLQNDPSIRHRFLNLLFEKPLVDPATGGPPHFIYAWLSDENAKKLGEAMIADVSCTIDLPSEAEKVEQSI